MYFVAAKISSRVYSYKKLRILYLITFIVLLPLYFGVFIDQSDAFLLATAANLIFYYWFYILWKRSRLRFSKLRPLFFLCLALFPIAGLIRIQHWADTNALFALAMAGLLLVYFMHFLQKSSKNFYEVTKLVWAISYLGLETLFYLKIISFPTIYVHMPLFLFMLFQVVHEERKLQSANAALKASMV